MPGPDRPRSLYDRVPKAAPVRGVVRVGAPARPGGEQMENVPWSLTTEQVGSEVVLRVAGALDLDTAGQLRSSGTSALHGSGPAPTLTVDLADVSFLDSTGLGVLVTLWHEARNVGGKFQVARPSSAAGRVLEITGVDALFDLT
ncbi:STAS domain-containing protein [Cryptosporangium sp. NPDC051539]|uniref:STAS domain-containing protein n=1 Tax=Cryptosporangium sp. NPDC051539 TaxID=3363962 RepID=UPI0037A10D79